MAKLTRTDLLSRVFQDPKNYPYGFSRSGDFSITEARALSAFGNLIDALLAGRLQPENDEDRALLAVALGEQEPTTTPEKAWIKYVKRIHRQRTGSIYGRRHAENSDTSDDDISDEPLDTDIALEQDEG